MESVGNIEWSSIGSIGTIIALCVISITQIAKEWLKWKREDGEQALIRETNRAMSELTVSFYDYVAKDLHAKKEFLTMLHDIMEQYSDNISQAKAETLIRAKMDLVKYRIVRVVHEIAAENNIESQRDEIKSKINSSMGNIVDNTSDWLGEFKCNSVSLGSLVQTEKWSKDLSNCMYGMVIQHKKPKAIVAYLDNKFTSYTLGMIKELKQLQHD